MNWFSSGRFAKIFLFTCVLFLEISISAFGEKTKNYLNSHLADQCLIKRRDGAFEHQDTGKIAGETATQAKAGTSSDTKNVMFFDEEDSHEVVAPWRELRTARRSRRIRECRKVQEHTQRWAKVLYRRYKESKLGKEKGTNSKCKAIIGALGQRVEKYGLMNSFALALARI